ncbi:MAG TPA: hypothetical protein DEA26_08305 [Oceanospirillales bacterium]|nr:hypothetical protein [Oceanospirillaceae bacterium]MAR01758.1 hypothetical protein [Oceanospirillaceae bacterium]HBS42669.1 hypothetical protein [Oceanospirillales bacterium]|tara:strand:+ start:463 stop:714 length:252 start_codon:yes stop_codon:yes gene_type:complete
MNIGSTAGSEISSAAAGLSQAVSQVSRAAQQVVSAATARPVEPTGESAEVMTDLKESQVVVEANAKVVAAEDEMLGTIIDTEA